MTITAPSYSTMSLADLEAERAAWDRLHETSRHWTPSCFEVIEKARAKCVAAINERGEARAA